MPTYKKRGTAEYVYIHERKLKRIIEIAKREIKWINVLSERISKWWYLR